MALTEAETDALAGKIARLALLWAGGDPSRIAEAVTILESSPALSGPRKAVCAVSAATYRKIPGRECLGEIEGESAHVA